MQPEHLSPDARTQHQGHVRAVNLRDGKSDEQGAPCVIVREPNAMPESVNVSLVEMLEFPASALDGACPAAATGPTTAGPRLSVLPAINCGTALSRNEMGVPNVILEGADECSKLRHSPRSPTLTTPVCVTNKFSGLMSRCTIPAAWIASRPCGHGNTENQRIVNLRAPVHSRPSWRR